MSINQQVSWPYHSEDLLKTLNPEQIEQHAREILARSLTNGRLVAFIGAGVSQAYGRPSWSGLVEFVLMQVQKAWIELMNYQDECLGKKIDSDAQPLPETWELPFVTLSDKLKIIHTKTEIDEIRKKINAKNNNEDEISKIWKQLDIPSAAKTGKEPELYLHLCGQALELLNNCPGRTDELLMEIVKLHKNDRDKLIQIFEENKKTAPGQSINDIQKQIDDLNKKKDEKEKPLITFINQAKGSVLARIVALEFKKRQFVKIKPLGGYDTNKYFGTEGPGDLTPKDIAMPLGLLLDDLAIRRLATTNYDHEIEIELKEHLNWSFQNNLEENSPETPDWAPLWKSSFNSVPLEFNTIGHAMNFSLDGHRRNVSILHLHGSCEKPETTILSEWDYQRRYLRNDPRRDLMDNAIHTFFGANPIVYIGSQVNEDDVFRPLRQFMSSATRRNDTLGIALIPASSSREELNQQKIKQLIRHGIHTIHYGDKATYQNSEGIEAEEPWLYGIAKAQKKILKDIEFLLEIEKNLSNENLKKNPQIHVYLRLIREYLKENTESEAKDIITLLIQSLQSTYHNLEEDNVAEKKFIKDFYGKLESYKEEFEATIKLNVPQTIDRKTLKELQIEYEVNLLISIEKWLKKGIFEICSGSILTDILAETKTIVYTIGTRITTACLCGFLKKQKEFRQEWVEKLTDPVSPCSLMKIDKSLQDNCYKHIAIDFGKLGGNVENFLNPADTAKDERWDEFINFLKGHPKFSGHRGRRILLIPTPRGTGKGSMFDRLNEHIDVRNKFFEALGIKEKNCRIAFFSLMFLVDITNIVDTINQLFLAWTGETPPAVRNTGFYAPLANSDVNVEHDVVGRLFSTFSKLREKNKSYFSRSKRIVLVFSNMGSLFSRDGMPKNGQLVRIMNIISSSRFKDIPLDIVAFFDDEHLPAKFLQSKIFKTRDDLDRHWQQFSEITETNQQRAVERLTSRGIIKHPIYFPGLCIYVPARASIFSLVRPFLTKPGEKWFDNNRFDIGGKIFEPLHRAAGSHRIIFTQLMALALVASRFNENTDDNKPGKPKKDNCINLNDTEIVNRLEKFATEVHSSLAGHIQDALPNSAMQFIFNKWEWMYRSKLGDVIAGDIEEIITSVWGIEPEIKWAGNLEDFLKNLKKFNWWNLMVELLWHLSVISHPVEIAALALCPGVKHQLNELLLFIPEQDKSDNEKISNYKHKFLRIALDMCVCQCLAFRILPRKISNFSKGSQFKRYTVHRVVQRHFLRMMGGRNVDAIEWDQFTTSLYASQPDEAPALSLDAHKKLTHTIRELSQYRRYNYDKDKINARPAPPITEENAWEEAVALRAAYFIARSTYSLGVLSHVARESEEINYFSTPGHMEEYRRLVRWITHRAEALAGSDPAQSRQPFLAGELIWLYAECGAVSLTQGKMEDSEALLQLALRAARRVETGESGSLHVRILLHLAMTHIERGCPSDAKRILRPIESRKNGHPVPPLLAKYHLGLLDHLAGDYARAQTRYEEALKGLRDLHRNRAVALVLKHQADLKLASLPKNMDEALKLAKEASFIAQRGGHEDVRIQALLTQVRIQSKMTGGFKADENHQLLDQAEQYARLMDIPRIQCSVHELRASLLLEQGETRLSAQEAARSAELAALYDLKLMKVKAMLILARVYWRRNEAEQARVIVMRGMEMAKSSEYFSCVRGFRNLYNLISNGSSRNLN